MKVLIALATQIVPRLSWFTNVPGFCIEKNIEGANRTSELKLVDAGGCSVTGSFRAGSAAVWAHLGDAAQWRAYERPGRLLVVEGEPDRFPNQDESLEGWLPRRWSWRATRRYAGSGGGCRRART